MLLQNFREKPLTQLSEFAIVAATCPTHSQKSIYDRRTI
jgi:hypothetical protein